MATITDVHASKKILAVKKILAFLLLSVFLFIFNSNLFAVELLIKRQANYTHDDPVKNEAGVAQRGDIVVVKPDGWSWGIEEHPLTATRFSPPRFFIVKIPGITVAQAKKYIQSRVDSFASDGDPIIKTFRLWKIEADSVPQWVKDSIKNTGEVTVTWNQIRNYIRNKKTGATE